MLSSVFVGQSYELVEIDGKFTLNRSLRSECSRRFGANSSFKVRSVICLMEFGLYFLKANTRSIVSFIEKRKERRGEKLGRRHPPTHPNSVVSYSHEPMSQKRGMIVFVKA